MFFPQDLDVSLSYIFKYFLIFAVFDVHLIYIIFIYEMNDLIIESYWMGYGIFDSYFSDRKDTLFNVKLSAIVIYSCNFYIICKVMNAYAGPKKSIEIGLVKMMYFFLGRSEGNTAVIGFQFLLQSY